jgi:lysophospholipase L1-like esterase
MAKDAAVEKAIENGRAQAARILKVRQKALRRRERALKSTAKLAMRGAAAVAAGTLVAEGDSWFDYPFDDVLKELEDGFAYEIESVAHKGDPIEEMAYGGGQLEELTRRLEKLLRHGTVPKAILISGGGNDVVGVEFAMLLNHVDSAIAGLNGKVLDGVVDERVRLAYAHIIASVTDVCEKMTGARVPILVHGYDYPVPDGRGFWGGWAFLPGPWLEPGFRQKGFGDLAQRKRIARELIDRMNAMVSALCALPEFAHVHHVDLRQVLSSGDDYEDWWDNELHPTAKGFKKVAQRFENALQALP